ncbi:MAG: hypothetical protein A2992_10355 [Elusimicrobia bacterium RIFCSPLOWO2_01_FULL_59_12]|nr:MAG: hypothetical protein A2992_10355 [Elusimicrobia bacterium RIFCSPLOWO2_01_FULL_59_12]
MIRTACLAALLAASSFGGIVPARVAPLPVPEELQAGTAMETAAVESPILQEGEDLKFAIKWGVVTAGYSSLKVQNIETIEKRLAHHVVAEARSSGMVNTFYKVRDRNETWIDLRTPSTLRYARNIREGKYRLEEQVVLDQDSRRFYLRSYRADKKRHESKEGEIPANVLDVLGSFYYVRTLPLEVGRRFTIDVHSGDTVYPMVVSVKRRQRIKVKAGKFDCFVIEPELREPGIFISKGKKLEVFITADARRLPVLMRSEIFIGHVAAELVSHRTLPLTETYKVSRGRKTGPAALPEQELE